jgi:hypothetical protein
MNVAELTDADWENLTRDLSSRVAAFAPDWTDTSGGDPGITLLELFAFLGESLLDRADDSSRVVSRLRDIVARLERIAASRCADGTLTRPRYFDGKVLTAADLELEQDYGRARHRRHNRLLHGVGVVSGYGVSLGSDDDGQVVIVSPGLAIGLTGEELLLCEPVQLALPRDGSARYVTVGLGERAVDPDPSGDATRIEEFAAVAAADEVAPGYLPIARLSRAGDTYQLDGSFEAARMDR